MVSHRHLRQNNSNPVDSYCDQQDRLSMGRLAGQRQCQEGHIALGRGARPQILGTRLGPFLLDVDASWTKRPCFWRHLRGCVI